MTFSCSVLFCSCFVFCPVPASAWRDRGVYLMRLQYFLSSVNSFFKRAYAVIQWGWMSDFLAGLFVYFHTSCLRTAMALARLHGCAGSPDPSLVAYVISTIISSAGSFCLSAVNFIVCETRMPIHVLVRH